MAKQIKVKVIRGKAKVKKVAGRRPNKARKRTLKSRMA